MTAPDATVLVRAAALAELGAAGCLSPELFRPLVESQLRIENGRVLAADASGDGAATVVARVRAEYEAKSRGRFFRS